jgi:hypothetical protein
VEDEITLQTPQCRLKNSASISPAIHQSGIIFISTTNATRRRIPVT